MIIYNVYVFNVFVGSIRGTYPPSVREWAWNCMEVYFPWASGPDVMAGRGHKGLITPDMYERGWERGFTTERRRKGFSYCLWGGKPRKKKWRKQVCFIPCTSSPGFSFYFFTSLYFFYFFVSAFVSFSFTSLHICHIVLLFPSLPSSCPFFLAFYSLYHPSLPTSTPTTSPPTRPGRLWGGYRQMAEVACPCKCPSVCMCMLPAGGRQEPTCRRGCDGDGGRAEERRGGRTDRTAEDGI